MRILFADTFYFLAYLGEDDDAHAMAVEASRDETAQLVTTAWVLTEVADALAATRLRQDFVKLLRRLQDDPRTAIVTPSQKLFEQGVTLYARRPDKEWSLTDCISFAVMEDTGITEALTGDRHFEQGGFTALLK